MSGMGRGGRGIGLLQALSEKKKQEEEAKQTELRAAQQLVELNEKKKLEEQKALEIANEQKEKPLGLPALGRGRSSMIASLRTKTTVTSQIKRISPTEEVTKDIASLTVKDDSSSQKMPSKLLSIGRGFRPKAVLNPGISHTEAESTPPPKPTSHIMKEEKPKSEIASEIKSQGQSAHGSGTGSAPGLSTISSIEKAVEELKVEQILRQSPVRKVGEAGTPTNFSTNYIKLKCKNQGVFQYVVHFNPPVDNQFTRIKLLYHCSEVTGSVRLFDGHTLFLPILLKDKVTTIKARAKSESNEVTLRIQLTKILPPEQIPPTVFNIIFKNIMKVLQMSRIGLHYFSSLKQINVPNHNLQIWPGYVTAVQEFEDGLYLVVDIAHKVLRNDTCWHVMVNLNRNAKSIDNFREQVFNSIIGNIVLTRYNNKTYRIDDIMWDENPMSEFVYHNGQRTTYFAYYKEHYNIEIKDLKQPLLLHRAKKAKKSQSASPSNEEKKTTEIICLIPELCFMTGMSEEIKNDIKIKKELSAHTRLNPKQKCEQLMELIKNIRETPEALKQITNWGLELDENFSEIQGRVLPREKIIFAKKEVETDGKCDWTRAAGNEEVVKAVDIRNWLIVYPAQKENIVERFCSLAMDSSRRTGIRLSMPRTVALRDDRPETYYNEIKANLNENIQMVVIVFNMISDSRYSRVKRLCCIECPVPSQVIVLKTINKPDNVLKTVAQKIILQMNVKLGGELWRLSIPIKKCMIVGIDVYHKTDKKYNSITGFVSSLNHDQTRWYSKVCFQMVGQELTDTLKIAFMQSLKKYQEVNNFLPDRIFIYRDGVSEGQLATLTEHEVTQLRSCFANDYCPQLAVIVVQKRISTRIFSKKYRDPENPTPGAILDHSITSIANFDFYLISQHVNQGTVTPTHYIVAFDETHLKPDHIQRLSYKMTHLYYNWSGTIRVPAPCQYAHKLAFLTGQYLQEEPSEALCNRLFYL